MLQELRGGVIRLLFYPTLLWNLFLKSIGRRSWWSWIDDRLLLGALPFPSHVPALKKLGITGVVNLCAEYRGASAALQGAGIEELYLPVIDFTPPDLEQVRKGVEFIRRHLEAGGKVYVHCKAGRGRSANIVLCYLMAREGLTPAAALARILDRRPHINRRLHRRRVVLEFQEQLENQPRQGGKVW